jgi:glycosyltransferase involved in cell wall biosynthesis
MEHAPPPGAFRNRLGIPSETPLILFLGRINKKKGADMLVEAFGKMQNRSVHLVIAGPDDGQLAEVQSLIQKYGLQERVSLPGLVTGHEVLAAFRDSDLFVLPCRADTFPVVMMESCLAGTPMVITDRCEIAHLVKDRVSEVVPFDAGLFAQAIDTLLADRQKYGQYKANCSQIIADTFSIQAVADQLETIYQRAIAEKRHP